MSEPSPPERVYGLSKWSDIGYTTIDMLYIPPVRWFHQNFVERFRDPSYPYYHHEGRIDALDKCAKEKDALFESHANWYQKYGEMGVPHSCVDVYMKQKHLMIWMRRHPEVDLKGWALEREYE